MTPGTFPSRAGHDRWLVSYADLVTLLLAFFTAMYAASTVDSNKLGPMSVSLQRAFTVAPGARIPAGASIVEPVAVLDHPDALDAIHVRLAGEFAEAIDQQQLELVRDARGVVISLPENATFPIGSAESTAAARTLLARLGATLQAAPNAVRIEGHTDDVPIRTAKYGSNWELSTARAAAVVSFLIETAHVDAAQLSAAGYGEFHPRAPNDSAANRARNRRVDIVILDARAGR